MRYRVIRIDEDLDFGCEEHSDDTPVMAVVTLEDNAGIQMVIRYPDQELYDQDINEGDLVEWEESAKLLKVYPTLSPESLALLAVKREKSKLTFRDWEQVGAILESGELLCYEAEGFVPQIGCLEGVSVEYDYFAAFTSREALDARLKELRDLGAIGEYVRFKSYPWKALIEKAARRQMDICLDPMEDRFRRYFRYSVADRKMERMN